MLGKFKLWVLASLLVFLSAIPLPTQALTWNFLGNKSIDGSRDHEKIQVRRHDGSLQSILLRVTGDAIFFDRVVVHFQDGNSQELAIGGRIWPGGKAQIISLSGESRVVESVEVWYFKQ